MIGIKIRGGFLVTNSSTAISFELVSTIFLGDGESFTPGSYSFPFDLPLEENRITLGLPEIIGNAEPLLSKEPCEVYFDNIRLPLEGLATISEVSGGVIKFYITIQALEPLKDVKLADLDLGGARDLGVTVPSRLTAAKATATGPSSFDFAFFPVQNLRFWEGAETPPSHPSRNIQNFWDSDTEAFISNTTQGTVTPFVRLDYLLAKIFEHSGLRFTNSFQTVDELRQLYLYNSTNAFVGEFPRYINLLDHVPADVKATDLLRYVQRMFCLGIVKEPFDPDYELIPLGDLLAQAPTHDWTDRLLANPTKSQTTNRIGGFVQLNDGFEAPDGATNITLPPFTVAGTVDTYYDTIPLTVPGCYYVRALDCYYLLTDVYSALYFPQSQYIHDPEDDSRLNLDLGAANTTQVSMVQLDGDIRGGTMPFVTLPGGSTLKPAKYPLLLLAYRGIYDLHNPPGKLPLASRAPYDMLGNVIGDYSLGWDGPLGIYAKWWKNWHQFLYNRTEVTARLMLTLPDILNFRFKHIVRIQNMNYFVKSLRVNFTQRGLEPVEAKLVSLV